MNGGFVREIVNLVTAGGSGSYNRRGRVFAANQREEASFSDLAGNLEVFS